MCLYNRQAQKNMERCDKDIINKVLDNTSSKEEAASVLEWFANSIEGQSCLSESLDKDFYLLEELGLEDGMISPFQAERILSEVNKVIHKKRLSSILFKVAAILLPFVLIASMSIYINSQVGIFGNNNYSEIYVPKGETLRVLFQDGSEAYLNSDTKMRYPERFGLKNRKVYLEGEAYFNVTTNKKRPFIVETDKSSVAVFGTSFNVDAYNSDEEIKVVLDEGEIVFNTDVSKYKILPNQKIIYNKVSGLTTIINLEKTLEESIWKNNILHFSNTPLYEVVKTLNRRYNIRFVIENTDAFKYTYTLTSKQTSIENILLELEKIAPVEFVLIDNVVHASL